MNQQKQTLDTTLISDQVMAATMKDFKLSLMIASGAVNAFVLVAWLVIEYSKYQVVLVG